MLVQLIVLVSHLILQNVLTLLCKVSKITKKLFSKEEFKSSLNPILFWFYLKTTPPQLPFNQYYPDPIMSK